MRGIYHVLFSSSFYVGRDQLILVLEGGTELHAVCVCVWGGGGRYLCSAVLPVDGPQQCSGGRLLTASTEHSNDVHRTIEQLLVRGREREGWRKD